MKQYIGVKLVEAEPQSLDQHVGAKNPNDLSKLAGTVDQDGYKVVYEDGYISWSPKDVFEKVYKEIVVEIPEISSKLEPYQERVIVEARELNEKIEKLDEFIENNSIFKSLSEENQILYIQQVRSMQYYFGILIERIKKF